MTETRAAHYAVTTYLGTRCYDNAGRDLETLDLAERFARRCEGGGPRSGSGTPATITPCDCTDGHGRNNTLGS